MLKHSISDPYNFQHLTHTGTHDIKSLQNASQNDLVTEFSAIRASQTPLTELKGIKADNLELRSGSTGVSQATSFPVSCEGLTTSAPSSPDKSRDDWTNVSPSEGRLTLHSPSTDSFKRISSRSFSSLTPPVSPPPRRSSRIPIALPCDQLSVGQDSTSFFPNMTNNASSTSLRSNPPSPGASAGRSTNPFDQIDPSHVGHAITTLDDSAFNLKPLPLSPSSTALADVPEEDEGHHLELVSSYSLRSSTSSSAIRHTKSFPSISSSSRKSRILTPVLMPVSPKQTVASDPTLPLSDLQTEEIPRRTSKRFSATMNYINDNWEDDIDYCYEHAAEADCAFDWYRVSQEDDKMSSATEVMDEIIDGTTSGSEVIPRDSSHSSFALEGSTASSIPDSRSSSYLRTQLDLVLPINRDSTTLPSHSSISSATTVPGALTPFDSSISSPRVFDLSARNSHASLVLPLSPSFSAPREYQSHVIEEHIARDKLMTSEMVQHHFPLIGNGGDISLRRGDSLRSNDSPLSTCHSQESMLQMYSSSVDARHHPSSSLSNLPELIHSESRREQSDLETEDLVNQIDAMICNQPLTRFSQGTSLRKATSTTSIVEKVQGDVFSPIASGMFRSRERSLSASEDCILPETSIANSSAKDSAGRMRSASAATTMTGSKPSRTSYSLFPNVASR